MFVRRAAAVAAGSALLLVAHVASAASGPEPGTAPALGPVVVVPVSGALLPVTGDFLARALEVASRRQARLVLIELDTPGGLVTTVRTMVASILASPVPVAVYVTPDGASAASGGAFLVLAADVAAMAPVASIGAAHPVYMAGKNEKGDILLEKAENDLAAFIRSLAERRGRNPDEAELLVRESLSHSAQEALALGFIEWIATDREDLLAQIDGTEVARADGTVVPMTLAGATTEVVTMTVRETVLSVLSQPMVAFFLLALGLLGVYMEITHPGTLLPAAVGIICLLLFALASQVLPVNWGGVALIGLGLGLLVLEVYVVSYGALSVGGVGCMVVGSLVLFDTPPELRIPRGVVVSIALGVGLVALSLVRLAVTSQSRRPSTGREGLVGTVGEAVTDLRPAGKVLVHGEYYDAFAQRPVGRGERVEVIALDGRELRVGPAPRGPASSGPLPRG
ncbi:MAG: nodulation protein NfeD [Acidobacteriota bacterium]